MSLYYLLIWFIVYLTCVPNKCRTGARTTRHINRLCIYMLSKISSLHVDLFFFFRDQIGT